MDFPGGQMKADYFRQLYDYHFRANRKLWDGPITALSDEQFKQKLDYSTGSIHNQVVHLINTDNRWFAGLRGLEDPGSINPVHLPSREKIRQKWDQVEADMRAYLDALQDDDLAGSFQDQFEIWQVLFHVQNHGTDHRAQMLAMLHHLGAPTFPQDFVFYLLGRL
jgi:uncharacterized damage-inducible protein DinB